MLDLLITIFTPGNFEPHSIHFADNPMLMWVIVSMNILIAICYLLLPAELSYIYFKRRDFAFSWVFIVIAFFGVWCSMTHFMNALTFFYPAYWLEGIISLTTGTVSLVSFVAYAIAVPLILKLVGPQQLQEVNKKLSVEIEKRKEATDKLRQINLSLVKAHDEITRKKSELEKMNRVLETRASKVEEMETELARLKADRML